MDTCLSKWMSSIDRWKAGSVIYIVLLLPIFSCNSSNVKTSDLRCEYRENPLGIDNLQPRLSWKLIDSRHVRGQKQSAYQILVASSLDNLNDEQGDLWDSGKTDSHESVNIRYLGSDLASGQPCFWKVRVWDKDGLPSQWSETGRFTMGLLADEDWKGEWILKTDQLKTDHNWYRKTIDLSEEPQSAYLNLASFGYHELYVNGQKVTENVMNPVSSFMKKRIPYLTYDIRDLLNEGKNVIAVWHAAGWTRWPRVTELMNPPFVFKAQAEIVTETDTIRMGTDQSWKCKKSHSEYYGNWDILDFGGETIDDRKREDDWNIAEYDDADWANASIYDPELLNARLEGDNIRLTMNSNKSRTVRREYQEITAQLSAQMVEPQVRFRELLPVDIQRSSDSTFLIDMGENYTGFFEMNLYQGEEGDSVLFEIADQEGITSSWNQKSKYIYGASGEGRFENRFNVAGGRWITVYGLDYKPQLTDIRGYVVTNNRKQISSFQSSSELLNRIYQVNLNTILANTMDGIMVDCPHRERRGWGEVTVAATYGDALPNFESGAFFDQYTQYMRDAQFEDGRNRGIVNEQDRPFLMWKANNPLTIWETYRHYGDRKVLEDNYAAVLNWMSWMHNSSEYAEGGALKIGTPGLREMPGLGDWCTPRGNFWTSSNSPDAAHFNNCLYAFMLECAMNISKALGHSEDSGMFADRLNVQRNATHEISYNPETGQYLDGKQVDQAFALLTGVTPDSEQPKVVSQLENNLLYTFPYYDTGSSGQGLYTRYFIEHERMDLIYELLRDTHHPSYGYFLEQGKTTWPERWSAIGNSQIHTCYTGIGGYFVKGFGGIRTSQDQVGFQQFELKPAPVGDLTFANTSYESMYGSIVSEWKVDGNTFTYHVEIPVNTTAKVYIPASSADMITENGVPAGESEGVSFVGTEISKSVGSYVIYDLASGHYDLVSTTLPVTIFPDPLGLVTNLATIGRMSASSMYIETEKLPGFEAFKANDENPETSWQAASTQEQWLEVVWLKPQSFHQVIIDEEGENIRSHKIQYWRDGHWIDLAEGTDCGHGKSYLFESISSTKCRVLITDSDSPALISEIRIM